MPKSSFYVKYANDRWPLIPAIFPNPLNGYIIIIIWKSQPEVNKSSICSTNCWWSSAHTSSSSSSSSSSDPKFTRVHHPVAAAALCNLCRWFLLKAAESSIDHLAGGNFLYLFIRQSSVSCTNQSVCNSHRNYSQNETWRHHHITLAASRRVPLVDLHLFVQDAIHPGMWLIVSFYPPPTIYEVIINNIQQQQQQHHPMKITTRFTVLLLAG